MTVTTEPSAVPDPAASTVGGGTDTPIVVEGASKWFGSVVALSEVTCSIGWGITALLGPNGAGKSTLFRLLCGLTAPSNGTVRVLGLDPKRDVSLSRHIGLVPQQEPLFEALTPIEFVRLAANLHGLPYPDTAAQRALAVVELQDVEDRPIATFSKGMRQRVKVAQAIVHEPDVIFLDEPLTGLDPRQRLHLVSLFQRLGDQGRCVLVSSHVLDEIERFGSRVLVVVQGRLAAEGDFHAIRDLMDDRPHRVAVRCEQARLVATALMYNGSAAGVELTADDELVVDTADIAGFRHSIATVTAHYGARLYEVRPVDDDLESVFRYLVTGG
jgi:ABC-2 type transport system ATP-binding protein